MRFDGYRGWFNKGTFYKVAGRIWEKQVRICSVSQGLKHSVDVTCYGWRAQIRKQLWESREGDAGRRDILTPAVYFVRRGGSQRETGRGGTEVRG